MTVADANRAVLVTGCSSGIGHCLATGLAARGYRVFASARDPEDVRRLQADGLEALQLDLADPVSIEAAFAALRVATGERLLALINNAAYGQPGAVEDLATDVLRRQFETNLFGTHELTRLAIPLMRAQGHGHIIQVSSILGLVCLPYRGAYNASKHALEALSDTLRLELAGTGIHVSLVEPGPVSSRFRENAYRAFREHIDPSRSAHAQAYDKEVARLRSNRPVPGTLPPEAVLEAVIHCLESGRPRIRYVVTRPAKILSLLKRILSDRMLDRLLLRVSGHAR